MPRHKRTDSGNAFLPDPLEGAPARTRVELAETLAEEYLRAATSAEDVSTELRDEVLPEEMGGPFLEVPASEEFDRKTDPSNPPDAEREPFPLAVRTRGT